MGHKHFDGSKDTPAEVMETCGQQGYVCGIKVNCILWFSWLYLTSSKLILFFWTVVLKQFEHDALSYIFKKSRILKDMVPLVKVIVCSILRGNLGWIRMTTEFRVFNKEVAKWYHNSFWLSWYLEWWITQWWLLTRCWLAKMCIDGGCL